MTIDLKKFEVWFITGSQILYGEEVLKKVTQHSAEIAGYLDQVESIPVRVIHKPTLTLPEAILEVCQLANSADNCIGLILWMHTFSPAKMWIRGLKVLHKPMLHLHTQFNRDIPWADIDMDFMNLNQSAHGDREFGFIGSRMQLGRKVVTGYWKDPEVTEKIGIWTRSASGFHDLQGGRFARFGDNMRQVAVTEGDKVGAEIKLGCSVNGFGVGDLVAIMDEVGDGQVDELVAEYDNHYDMAEALKPAGDRRASLRDAARIELGLKTFLSQGDFKGFTDTMEDLHGLKQLPGIAVQRLMRQGYGFGAEGDWKTCVMVRAIKVMASGMKGGNSFMEDYTYHLDPAGNQVLGAHMLEICESIASAQPRCEIHPLSIGGKEDPVRLVFNVEPGPAINVSLIDLGHRFRLLLNEVDAVAPLEDLPKLPVARALWTPRPNLSVAASAWILAGGAHHTVYSQSLPTEAIEDFAEMAGIELVVIDQDTRIREFKKELRWNQASYRRF